MKSTHPIEVDIRVRVEDHGQNEKESRIEIVKRREIGRISA